MPYTPECRWAESKAWLSIPSQIALALTERAQAAGISFEAIMADCAYGEQASLAEVGRLYGLRNWIEKATSR